MNSDIYLGLSGLEIDFSKLEFGHGVHISKTYAHLMLPCIMAFTPAETGMHHPAPWRPASGSRGFDITTEMRIPMDLKINSMGHNEIAKYIIALIRLWISPAIIIPVISNMSFSHTAETDNKDVDLLPFEIERRKLDFKKKSNAPFTEKDFEWVAKNWYNTMNLASRYKEFEIALSALDAFYNQESEGMNMVSIWGALESLFSKETYELRFRVSALISAYLEKPGETRYELFNRLKKLYNARSKAAHGKPTCEFVELSESYDVLRKSIIKMIEKNSIPSRTDLESHLFGFN